MRRIGMRLLALCCCLALSASLITAAAAASTENCPGSCSHEAAIGTTHYDTLAEALSAATDSATVTVLKDISGSPLLTLDKAITLDLGGKTLSGETDPYKALLTVTKDATITNGTLSCSSGHCLTATDCTVTIGESAILRAPMSATGSSGTVTVNFNGTVISSGFGITTSSANNANCIINIGKSAVISTDNNAVSIWGKGQLNIAGGTITSKKNAVVLDIADNCSMEASITGGKFQVTNGETIVITTGTNATAPAGFVTGGTYNKVPSAYIASNCRAKDNGDGTYTVVAQHSVSIPDASLNNKVDSGATITLPTSAASTPSGKHLKAWEAGGKTYAPGASITVTGDLTLKPVWESHTGGSTACGRQPVCSVCGAAYGSVNPHNLIVSAGSEATCTEDGKTAHSQCSSCGGYFADGVSVSADALSIPALGHDMVSVEAHPATCTEDGIAAHEVCSICGVMEIAGETVTEEELVTPASGHTLETVAAVDSTCTLPGIIAHERCAECGTQFLSGKETSAEALSVPVTAHVLSEWESDEATHWKTCTDCSEMFRQHSHKNTDADEFCDDCGYQLSAGSVDAAEESNRSFSWWLFLLPVVAAVAIAIALIVKNRK